MTYTLEDYLVGLHTGQWFGWSDSKNKIYANHTNRVLAHQNYQNTLYVDNYILEKLHEHTY